MYNEKTNELEQKLANVFGNNTSIAITNARLGEKGYMVRVESQGVPFTIDAYKGTNEEAEELALEEFEIHLNKAIQEELLPTHPLANYEKLLLTKGQLDKLYKHLDMPIKSLLKSIKEKTSAIICQLEDGRYECVINGPYNLHARSTSRSRKTAIETTILVAHDILKPSSIKVGDWPFKTC